MYITSTTFEPKPTGLNFYPIETCKCPDSACELRVTFQPLAYYPEESDTNAGADFDAKIICIEIRDGALSNDEKAWCKLEPREAALARTFLETHCADEMWAEAEIECAEAFGYRDRWAA